MAEKQPDQQTLSRGLKDRHVQLIALVVRWYGAVLGFREIHSRCWSFHSASISDYGDHVLLVDAGAGRTLAG